MFRQGTVHQIDPSLVHVQLDPIAGCGRCSQRGSCGVQLLPQQNNAIIVECEHAKPHSLTIGDRVTVDIANPDQAWLNIVSLAYGLPIIGMLLGASGGYLLHGLLAASSAEFALSVPSQDVFSALGFLFGLAGGLFAWDQRKQSVNPGSAKIGGKLL